MDARHCKFILLGIGYFYNPINIFLSFVLAQLGNSLIISNLAFFDSLDGLRTRLSLGVIILHYWGKNFYSILVNAPWIMCFSCVADGNRTISGPMCALGTLPLIFFGWFFLQPLTVFSHICADHILLKLERDSMQILRVFSLCSSLLFGTSPCTAYRSCLSLPAALASSSQLWKYAELYLDFPSWAMGR